MSSTEKALIPEVCRVLWEQWDPIGVNDRPEARTEYDSYAGTLVAMLMRGCSAYELESHLATLETDAMGLQPRPASSRKTSISALLALSDKHSTSSR